MTPPPPTTTIPVYILAGGSSSRFGGDKARALVLGDPLLRRVAEELSPVAASLTVVAEREGGYDDLGLRTIEDRRHGLGPLCGLHRALEDQAQRVPDGGDWLLLASCDLVGVRTRWIEDLLGRREEGVRVVAFKGQRWEPMPALYHRDLLATVAERIEQGPLALWRLIECAAHVRVPYPEDWGRAVQINTPADLEHYLKAKGALDQQ